MKGVLSEIYTQLNKEILNNLTLPFINDNGHVIEIAKMVVPYEIVIFHELVHIFHFVSNPLLLLLEKNKAHGFYFDSKGNQCIRENILENQKKLISMNILAEAFGKNQIKINPYGTLFDNVTFEELWKDSYGDINFAEVSCILGKNPFIPEADTPILDLVSENAIRKFLQFPLRLAYNFDIFTKGKSECNQIKIKGEGVQVPEKLLDRLEGSIEELFRRLQIDFS